jgi:hypothetical protein
MGWFLIPTSVSTVWDLQENKQKIMQKRNNGLI